MLGRRGANEKSDIYSFGVMVWEVYTGRSPDPYVGCSVQSSWPVAKLLEGDGAAHRGAFADKKEDRCTALQLKDELEKLQ